MDQRTAPHNLEAERAVLGSIIIENARLDDAAAILDAGMWYRVSHRLVWLAMLALQDRKVGIDLVTLREQLERASQLEDAGGPAYIASLIDGVPRSTNLEHYAQIVRDKYQLRQLIRASVDNLNAAYEDGGSAEEIIDLALARIARVGEAATELDFEGAYDWMTRAASEVQKRLEDPREVTGVSSGIVALDRHTRGFQGSALYYVGARPGVGKSAFGLQVGLHAARSGVHTLYASLEMSKLELAIRAVAIESQVDAFRLSTGHITPYEQQRAAAAWSRIAEMPFKIGDAHNLTAPRLRAMIRRLHSRERVGLVIVDYIQLLKDTEKHFNRNSELEAISRAFKTLSIDLNLPIVVLSQLSRPPKDHKGPPPLPRLTDLRDSGALEQDADAVLMLHRYPVKEDASTDTEDGCIVVAKQRSGPTGMVKMHFIGPTTTWKERSSPPPLEKQQEFPDAAPWEAP